MISRQRVAFEHDTHHGPAMRELLRDAETRVDYMGGERITIDREVAFEGGDGDVAANCGVAIVETKSATGNGLADQVLRRLHQHPVSRCSKYCLALIALGKVTRFNNFRPVARMLGVVPGDSGPILHAA